MGGPTWPTRPSRRWTWRTGAIVGVTVQGADTGDTTTLVETLITAAAQVEAVQPDGPGIEEVVGDKGYHSNETLVDLQAVGLRTYLSVPDRGRRCWQGRPAGPRRRVCQPAPGSRGAGPSSAALPGGVAGAAVCASVRNRWDAAGASSGASQHPEAAARACRRLQPRAAPAAPDRRRHAPEPSGAGPWPRFCALIRRWCDRWGPLGRFWTPLLPTSSRTASSPRHQASRPSI